MKHKKIQITECSRDAMQGLEYIPTNLKIDYINSLLKIGFETIDFGSFVSPKAIPQFRDTAEVIPALVMTNTKLLSIIGNMHGAEQACGYEHISYLGFPYSVSEIFLKKNLNTDKEKALNTIERINNHCVNRDKKLVVYISMAFGNLYEELCNEEIIYNAVNDLNERGVQIINLSDTVGVGEPKLFNDYFTHLISSFSQIDFALHLHTKKQHWYEKIEAAYKAGVYRFDSAIFGLGGCPLTGHEMIGNLDTANLLYFFPAELLDIDMEEYHKTLTFANLIFQQYLK